ncbi:putative Bacteriophage protein [Cupriavidus necator]|uniref:Putative Bacteriophage protein n=1 Tax=Cupriavidus necator TaxID=106590 RepID=A0A1K0J373_CUPNE|nr:putative Bacteriophage protein [Cupriavidus necator]
MTKRTWITWSPAEDAILGELWASNRPLKEGLHRLPGRTHRAAVAHGYELGLGERTIKRDYSPTWEAIKAALGKQRMSAKALAALTGASLRAVAQQLADHHGTDVRVAAYSKANARGIPTAIRTLGKGKDAARPPRTPLSVIYKRQYRRLKEDRPDLLAARNAAMRLRYAEKTGKLIRRDPAAAWIPATHHGAP